MAINLSFASPYWSSSQNIGGATIHSKLCIISSYASFYTCTYTDNELRSFLLKATTIIIDEISIVSAKLLDFISNIFANLHNMPLHLVV